MTLRHYLTDQRSQKHALREKISGYYIVFKTGIEQVQTAKKSFTFR
jgi:hypothetical protein